MSKALEIAECLDAVPENGADPDLIQSAAAELRRLAAENEAMKADAAKAKPQQAEAQPETLRSAYALSRQRQPLYSDDEMFHPNDD